MQRVMRSAQVRLLQAEEVEGVTVSAGIDVMGREHSMRLHSMQEHLMWLHGDRSLATLRDMTASPAAPRTKRRVPAAPVGEWRELLDRHAKVSCALENALQDEHSIGLSEFEILDRLVDANCGNYRMTDLARDIYLSQSALSRAVARLEQDGLVKRSMCSDDRRAIFVCLTGDGATRHRAALPTHREVLTRTWRD
jgi:DNA-binding MarR family transcriptional regulator